MNGVRQEAALPHPLQLRCVLAVESGGEQRGVAVSRVSVVCLPDPRDTHGITRHRLYICLIVNVGVLT